MKWCIVAVLSALLGVAGCRPLAVLRYTAFPDAPRFRHGDVVELHGLSGPVEVVRRPDGLWRIEAGSETDLMQIVGYLQARDRMFQMDLLRHMARGELAALLGNRRFGDGTTLEADVYNRFLGFRGGAMLFYEQASPEERRAVDAYVLGVNQWIDEKHLSIEHRLIGVAELRPWTAEDSLAIYQYLMFGLSGNADREVRRLLIACEAGVDAMERIWPTDLEFDHYVLPDADLRPETYPPQSGVVPELAAELAERCAEGRADGHHVLAASPLSGRPPVEQLAALWQVFAEGWSASNNWAVSGRHTASGKPILSSDPHLPHMNPPVLWGVEMRAGGLHVAGFVFPGLHRVVFGHNGSVAFGATTNHVDRQDLFVLRAREGGYELDGEIVPFELRTETFAVRDAEPVLATVRFTADGPLLNDLRPFLHGRIPLTVLHRAPARHATDLEAARGVNYAATADDVATALLQMEMGCTNWVFADTAGTIGYRSPCVVPVRRGWRGTFPAPGWLSRYRWDGFYPKGELPASTNPERGWIATANSRIVPSDRFPTAYNNDSAGPNRVRRIARRLDEAIAAGPLTAATSAAIQLDRAYADWPVVRDELAEGLCADSSGSELLRAVRRVLCDWDGVMDPNSSAPTVYVLLTHAMLDRALADELPGGAEGETWRYVQSLLQFEADVRRLWGLPADAPVWDDARTPARETKTDILRRALSDAVERGRARWGARLDRWTWGRVRPFVLRHPFGAGGGVMGSLFNAGPFSVGGGNETVFKNQFPRSDREHMRPAVGPPARFTVDLADPWSATYSFAGGESGWPRSPFYANLLEDWTVGRGRPLTPRRSEDDLRVHFVPAARAVTVSRASAFSD